MKNKKWRVAKGDPQKEKILIDELSLATAVAKLLVNKGAWDIGSAKAILEPSLTRFHDPFTMKDMPLAVERLLKAYDENEKVVIFGDYDVDGISSTALLISFLGKIGMQADFYIPERAKEGYGLNKNGVSAIKDDGGNLIITVDNGITANSAVDHANSLGVDVIVTDHHQPGDTLPNAVAVLDPHRRDCDYPFKGLSGVGIAFKLIAALRSALHKRGIEKEKLPNLKESLDLVALGTIADLAPLTGENRIIAKHGLDTLGQTKLVGLSSLMKVANITEAKVTARDVAFGIAPRLNAAGRLNKGGVCVTLLTTEDKAKAVEIATYLDTENQRRREIQQDILEEARKMVRETCDLEKERAIVLGGEGWNPGVVGIVASKLLDEFYLPVILICFEEDIGKGSARSIAGFHLFKAISDCRDDLLKFGGHELAAGLSVERAKFPSFKGKFLAVAKQRLKPDDCIPVVDIDAEVDPAIFDLELMNQINLLEPFGHGFPPPVFISRGMAINDVYYMGEEKSHVRLSIDAEAKVVGFSFGDYFREHDYTRNRFDMVYAPEVNRWNGRTRVQLRLIDVRLFGS